QYDTRQVSASEADTRNRGRLRGRVYHLCLTPSVSLPLLVAGVVAALVASLSAILPSFRLFGLLAILAWFAVPGVVLGRRLYAAQPGPWTAALLAGPACGYVLSSLALLALSTAGLRAIAWAMLPRSARLGAGL